MRPTLEEEADQRGRRSIGHRPALKDYSVTSLIIWELQRNLTGLVKLFSWYWHCLL